MATPIDASTSSSRASRRRRSSRSRLRQNVPDGVVQVAVLALTLWLFRIFYWYVYVPPWSMAGVILVVSLAAAIYFVFQRKQLLALGALALGLLLALLTKIDLSLPDFSGGPIEWAIAILIVVGGLGGLALIAVLLRNKFKN